MSVIKEMPVKSLHKNELDYMVLLNKLWAKRKTIFIAVAGGIVIGLLVAFLTPNSYQVTTTMLPQSESEGGMGKISSLASLAGFDLDLNSGESDISPIVYPQVLQSAPFMLELMNIPFTFKEVDHPVSIYDYYLKIKKPSVIELIRQYTIGLPNVIKASMKEKQSLSVKKQQGPIVMTEEQYMIMQLLNGCLDLSINKKEGYLTLTCTMPEPILAAQVAQQAQVLLQKYITEFKTKKAVDQLIFVERRCAEKKVDCINAQSRLASFQDRNWHISTAAALAEQERLQNEYDIANSVYSELAKSLEQAKIQVKRKTPVFAIIKPVVVPLEKEGPQRLKILAIWTIIGFVAGCGYIFGKEYLAYLKNRQTTIGNDLTD
ncbi:MAG: Wzz/FepE/Etk N-terminal domain-containing protein [Bacteroidota bacterium]|nr:Wzz/FepE/Etk N-terminal domain-containing protein [Bacteroidota bacterium]